MAKAITTTAEVVEITKPTKATAATTLPPPALPRPPRSVVIPVDVSCPLKAKGKASIRGRVAHQTTRPQHQQVLNVILAASPAASNHT